MKSKTIGAIGFALTIAMGMPSALAQKAATDCGVQPVMPEVPAEFTSEDHAGEVVGEIKGFQSALKGYRDCLDLIIKSDDEDISAETKQEALDAYNTSVDNEGAVVNRYMAAVTAWKEAHPE